MALQFDAQYRGGAYVKKGGDRDSFTRKDLIALASAGKFVGTFTARHGAKATVDHPQPAIWTLGPIERQRGRQDFPILHNEQDSMTISGRHFGDDAHVIVDGRRVPGAVSRQEGEKVVVTLSTLPKVGMHLLQVQVPEGMFSNDFIFHVAEDAAAAARLKRELDQAHVAPPGAVATAIGKGDLAKVRKALATKDAINARLPNGGSTPLSTAALHGQREIAKYLIENGADVSGANEDGNTPLHVAAFLCRAELVKLLLDKGASAFTKNKRGETPIDVVSSPWSNELADFYTGIGTTFGLKLDLKLIEQQRLQIAQLLRAHAAKSK